MPALIALLLGGLHGLVFTPPAELAWLGFTAQIALVMIAWWLLQRPGSGGGLSARRVGWLTWLFGVAHFSVGLNWLFISMHFYGGMPAPIAAAAVLALGAYLALFGAGAIALACRLSQGSKRSGPSTSLNAWHTAVLVATCWGGGELLRGLLFTGFPWLSIGYAHIDGPLAGYAPLVGIYGMSTLAVLVAVLLGTAIAARSPGRLAAASLVLVAGVPLADIEWTQTLDDAPLEVRLLQGNVPQSLKFDANRSAQAIAEYIGMIATSPAPFVIAPETSFTRPLESLSAARLQSLHAALARSKATAALGMPMRSTEAQVAGRPRASITNTMITVNANGEVVNRYDKRHLVPFGEFVPPGFGWFVDLMNIPLGEFGRGPVDQPLLALGTWRIGFNICYEDLFGEELAHQVRAGAAVLVNTSNIAWFGDSLALPQHLNISRLRTIELARPMLRATNTGVTAHIDHRGNVLARLPAFVQDVLDVEVQPMQGFTPYARFGLLAPLTLLGLLGVMAAALRRAQTRL